MQRGKAANTGLKNPIVNVLMTSQRNANPPTAAGVQIRRKASGIPVPVPQGTVWALLAGGSVMSVRGWEGARKSKILQIAQKGRKEAGGQAQPQARAVPRSGHGRAQGAPRHPQLTQPKSALGRDRAKSKTSAATEKPFVELAGELMSLESSFCRAQGTRHPAAWTWSRTGRGGGCAEGAPGTSRGAAG